MNYVHNNNMIMIILSYVNNSKQLSNELFYEVYISGFTLDPSTLNRLVIFPLIMVQMCSNDPLRNANAKITDLDRCIDLLDNYTSVYCITTVARRHINKAVSRPISYFKHTINWTIS